MSSDSIWTSTDTEGEHVPVRTKTETPTIQPALTPEGQKNVINCLPTDLRTGTKHPSSEPNPRLMTLSAITGVSVVSLVIFFSFGLSDLRGSLTSSGGTLKTPPTPSVTITADGNFVPSTIEVQANTTLRFTNENKDPQVLKTKNGKELFPVAVLFTDPVEVKIPVSASGSYQYYSETLPEDKILTIIIRNALSVETLALKTIDSSSSAVSSTSISSAMSLSSFSSSSSSALGESTDNLFPIPFGSVVQSTSSSSSSVSNSVAASNEPSEAVVLSVGEHSSRTDFHAAASQELPVNPYTVGTQTAEQKRAALLARQAELRMAQGLHSGAGEYDGASVVIHRPESVTRTGPNDILFYFAVIISVLATLGLSPMFMHQKK